MIESDYATAAVATPATPVDTNPLDQWFYDTFPVDLMSPEQVQDEIVRRLMNMSADDVLSASESIDSARQFERVPLRLECVQSVRPSSYGGIYVVVKATLLGTGEVATFALGSPTILAQLRVLVEGSKLPLECQVVPVRKTTEGRNPPYYLRPLDWR